MGQRVTQFDDLDENVTSDIETVQFGYNGESFAIDLGLENRVRLDTFLEEFIAKARKDEQTVKAAPLRSVSSGPTRPANPRSAAAQARTQRIREWARENGHDVKDGGRIKNDIIRLFEAANPEDTLERMESEADAG